MLSIETTTIRIPTYQRGPDDPYAPLTFSGHGRRLKPYPYAMQDDIDIATMAFKPDQQHRAVRMSNGLLEALVLLDMNGRLYSLRDLNTGRELFYRNHVVKPALVALRGAWLSGGIEFNVPTRGHSVSTVWPVFHRIDQSPDEVAITVGDVDRSTRQLWQARMALRAGRAALDVVVTLSNPNDYRERLYFWQNAAVPAADDLRFVCRCDWTVGAQATPFPVQNGADRSWHTNNPTPRDHFGYRSYQDFFGAYYRDARVGTYHVSPRYEAPGQKYFTWGTQTDGRIWEEFLTDHDGPYVEIQSGLLETQSVTQWLQPHRSVSAQGSWFGTADAAEITWANTHVAVGVTEADRDVRLDVVPIDLVGPHAVRVVGEPGDSVHAIDCQPGRTVSIERAGLRAFDLELRAPDGRLLLRERWDGPAGLASERPRSAPRQWCMMARETPGVRAAEEAERYHNWVGADKIARDESRVSPGPDRDLLLAAVGLKTSRPDAAVDDALRGLAADPANAELHTLAAASQLRRLRTQAAADAADAVRDHCLAARLDARFRAASLCMYAESYLLQDRLLDARAALEPAVDAGAPAPGLVVLLTGVCRRCGDRAAARGVLARAPHTLWPPLSGEWWLLDRGSAAAPELPGGSTDDRQLAVHQAELVLECLMGYWRVRWLDDLSALVEVAAQVWPHVESHPVTHLLRADMALERRDRPRARAHAQRAASLPVGFVHPARWEDAVLIERGIQLLGPEATRLRYLSGLWAAENNRVDDAVEHFKAAIGPGADDGLRRLAAKALADWAMHVAADREAAVEYLRLACQAGGEDRRLVLELDQQLEHEVASRQELLEQLPEAMRPRGDVTYRRARLALDSGRPADAVRLLRGTRFSVYEGGAGVRRLYVDALLVDALDHTAARRYDVAAERCRAVLEYPENLGAASYLGEHSRLARFLLGLIAQRGGHREEAERWWQDVMARGGPSAAYTVGDVDTKRLGRLDERLAVDLAQKRLGLQDAECATASDRAGSSAQRESLDQLSAELAGAIRSGSPGAGPVAERGLRKYPCSALLRILAGLARVEPLRE